MATHEKSELIEVMEFLLKKFHTERIIYILLTLASVVLLGILVYNMLGDGKIAEILTLLGPAGIITVTFSRILKMWTDCIELTKISMIRKIKEEDE